MLKDNITVENIQDFDVTIFFANCTIQHNFAYSMWKKNNYIKKHTGYTYLWNHNLNFMGEKKYIKACETIKNALQYFLVNHVYISLNLQKFSPSSTLKLWQLQKLHAKLTIYSTGLKIKFMSRLLFIIFENYFFPQKRIDKIFKMLVNTQM